MNKTTRYMIIAASILAAIIITVLIRNNRPHNLIEDIQNTDAQKEFDRKLAEQNKTLDSLNTALQNQYVTAETFVDSNGNTRVIQVYSNDMAVKAIDTLKTGDTMQLLSMVKFNNSNPNVKVKTKKGEGYIYFFYVREVEKVLKSKGLESLSRH